MNTYLAIAIQFLFNIVFITGVMYVLYRVAHKFLKEAVKEALSEFERDQRKKTMIDRALKDVQERRRRLS